mmetsp:Transcript_108860/g.314359  ORF Transcript_108860/g.314359 Transcript_108860/m.314359 type:complete len:221 (-) Transcript_108860:1709-2371(-)
MSSMDTINTTSRNSCDCPMALNCLRCSTCTGSRTSNASQVPDSWMRSLKPLEPDCSLTVRRKKRSPNRTTSSKMGACALTAGGGPSTSSMASKLRLAGGAAAAAGASSCLGASTRAAAAATGAWAAAPSPTPFRTVCGASMACTATSAGLPSAQSNNCKDCMATSNNGLPSAKSSSPPLQEAPATPDSATRSALSRQRMNSSLLTLSTATSFKASGAVNP